MLKTILFLGSFLLVSTSFAGDLEGNTTNVSVIGNTSITNSFTGGASWGNAGMKIGGRAIANSVIFDCATYTACGNNNNTTIKVRGNTTVQGNGIANSVIFNSD